MTGHARRYQWKRWQRLSMALSKASTPKEQAKQSDELELVPVLHLCNSPAERMTEYLFQLDM